MTDHTQLLHLQKIMLQNHAFWAFCKNTILISTTFGETQKQKQKIWSFEILMSKLKLVRISLVMFKISLNTRVAFWGYIHFITKYTEILLNLNFDRIQSSISECQIIFGFIGFEMMIRIFPLEILHPLCVFSSGPDPEKERKVFLSSIATVFENHQKVTFEFCLIIDFWFKSSWSLYIVG